MSGRIRVNVKFGETKVLVPCGDGSISVKEMIDKAIDKFRKLKKLVSAWMKEVAYSRPLQNNST